MKHQIFLSYIYAVCIASTLSDIHIYIYIYIIGSSCGRADSVMDSHTTGPRFKTQALTFRIVPPCLRKGPLNTKLVPEKNILVLIQKSHTHYQYLSYYACPRTSPLNTLLVPVQFLLVSVNRTVLNSLSPIRGARLSPNSFALLPPSSP